MNKVIIYWQGNKGRKWQVLVESALRILSWHFAVLFPYTYSIIQNCLTKHWSKHHFKWISFMYFCLCFDAFSGLQCQPNFFAKITGILIAIILMVSLSNVMSVLQQCKPDFSTKIWVAYLHSMTIWKPHFIFD